MEKEEEEEKNERQRAGMGKKNRAGRSISGIAPPNCGTGVEMSPPDCKTGGAFHCVASV
jgi:DNA invertase Pin-like site-specific DNA recombinase